MVHPAPPDRLGWQRSYRTGDHHGRRNARWYRSGQTQLSSAWAGREKLSRKQLIEFFATFHACTVIMEAYAGSHHMARKLAAFGHTVKQISPQFVRPFVKSNKKE
jgi:transposase